MFACYNQIRRVLHPQSAAVQSREHVRNRGQCECI